MVLGACSNNKLLTGFDSEKWGSDPHGCLGLRKELADGLMKRKDELLGLNANEIKSLLGKPDRIELYKRSQKFLVYYIEPDETCAEHKKKDIVENITIRFDALGRAREIVLYHQMG